MGLRAAISSKSSRQILFSQTYMYQLFLKFINLDTQSLEDHPALSPPLRTSLCLLPVVPFAYRLSSRGGLGHDNVGDCLNGILNYQLRKKKKPKKTSSYPSTKNFPFCPSRSSSFHKMKQRGTNVSVFSPWKYFESPFGRSVK